MLEFRDTAVYIISSDELSFSRMDSDRNTRKVLEVRVPSTVAQITPANSISGIIQCVNYTEKYTIIANV